MNVFAILRVVLMDLGIGSEFFGSFLIFAEVNKNLPELAVFLSMLGENPTVLKLAVDNVNLTLWDLRDLSVFL